MKYRTKKILSICVVPALVGLGLIAYNFKADNYALNAEVIVNDPYIRVSGSNSKSGAAFFELVNLAAHNDKLIKASSPVSERVELHTHIEVDDGIVRMVELEDGIVVYANDSHSLKRGADHVMFLGLYEPLKHGDVVPLTLEFERSGIVELQVPVDLQRGNDHKHHHH